MSDDSTRISRRAVLAGATALGAAALAPRLARAQGGAIRLGTLTPLTGAGRTTSTPTYT